MKKCTDEDVLMKLAKDGTRQSQEVTTLREFRKQFAEYHRAKTGRQTRRNSACRPYVEVFDQPYKREES